MRQLFASYADYRKVVDEVIQQCELALKEKQEKILYEQNKKKLLLDRDKELQSFIDWAISCNIPENDIPRDINLLCKIEKLLGLN